MRKALMMDENGRDLIHETIKDSTILCYDDDLLKVDIPPGWKKALILGMVTEGSGYIRIGTEEYVLEEGDGFFINYDCIYQIDINEWEGKCVLHSIIFSPSVIENVFVQDFAETYVSPLIGNERFKGMKLSEERIPDKEILRLFKKSWKYITEEEDFRETVISTLSQAVFLLSSISQKDSMPYSQKAINDLGKIKLMMTYINDNLIEDLDINNISGSAHVSENECTRIFRQTIGISPIQYVKNMRIKKSSELLRTTDIKIVDVALRSGFKDMSYFSKTFRLIKTLTPTEYREKYSF